MSFNNWESAKEIATEVFSTLEDVTSDPWDALAALSLLSEMIVEAVELNGREVAIVRADAKDHVHDEDIEGELDAVADVFGD